jgi:multiple sugar transport system substrate-binding protein
MTHKTLASRRGFLRALGLGIVGTALAACSGAAPASPTAAPAAAPTSAPAAAAATTAPAPTTAAAAATVAPTTAASTASTPAASAAPAGQGVSSIPSSIGGTVNWLVRTTPEENNGQKQIFEPAIKAAFPNIKINRIIVPSAQYIPKINTMAAAKESLEIWGFGGNYMDYWWRGLPQDLNSYIQADKWDVANYFLPGLSDIYAVQGHHFGLPQQPTYGSVGVYNKDLFQKAGLQPPPVSWDDETWTMDKALQYAQKLSSNAGTPDAVYGINISLWDEMTSLSYLWGTDSWLPEHYTNFIAPKSNFGNPGNIAAHQFRHDLIYKYKVHPDPSAMQGFAQFNDPFWSGKIAMEFDGGWLYWTLSDLKDVNFGYCAIPSGKANKNINFDDQWIMGRWSTNKDAAWAVMRVLTSPDATQKYSVFSGAPPAVASSKAAWIDQVSKHTGQSVEDLNTVTSGAIVPKRSQESPDHLFLQHPNIDTAYTNVISQLWNSSSATAEQVWPNITSAIDNVVAGIYKEFNGTRPKV